MSAYLTGLVWRCGCYDSGTLLVFLALADWANDDGQRIFPHLEQLAKKARLSVRQSQRALRELEDDEMIMAVKNATGGRGNRKEYNINVERVSNCHPLKTPIKGDMGDAERVTSTTIKGDMGVVSPTPPYIDNHQVNHQVSRQEDDDSGIDVPDPRIVEHAVSRICEILGIKLTDDPDRIRWPIMISRMLMDGLDLTKHIIPAAEVARDNAIFKLSYIRKVAFNIATGKTNEKSDRGDPPGSRRPLSAVSAFTLGAARAAGLLDEFGHPIVAAGRSEEPWDDEFGGDGGQTIEGRVTARR